MLGGPLLTPVAVLARGWSPEQTALVPPRATSLVSTTSPSRQVSSSTASRSGAPRLPVSRRPFCSTITVTELDQFGNPIAGGFVLFGSTGTSNTFSPASGSTNGSGVLSSRGRSYSLSTGGLDYGLVFGGSKTVLRGRVSNINRPSDVAGVYGAAGAGLAVGRGARAIVLTNQKGAVLELSGYQTGLMANADLSGLAITMR